MVAESCGCGGAERSEAQHPATLGADSKTGAEKSDADALQKKEAIEWIASNKINHVELKRLQTFLYGFEVR